VFFFMKQFVSIVYINQKSYTIELQLLLNNLRQLIFTKTFP